MAFSPERAEGDLLSIYARLDAALGGFGCGGSTTCCRFGVTGREPYVTKLERAVLAYTHDVALLRAPRYLGHNPAGGAMVVALIVMLIGTCATGYMMTTGSFWGAKWVEEVHETFANLTIGLVVVHVLGVLVASFEHRENLVKAMITGRKRPS